MGKKAQNKKIQKKPAKPRVRKQRRARRRRFKEFYDGKPDSDMDYYENGLEWTLDASGVDVSDHELE